MMAGISILFTNVMTHAAYDNFWPGPVKYPG